MFTSTSIEGAPNIKDAAVSRVKIPKETPPIPDDKTINISKIGSPKRTPFIESSTVDSKEKKASEKKILIGSLLDNSLINYSSAISTSVRIQKAEQNIEELEQIDPGPGTSKFIADRKKAISVFKKKKSNSEHQYYEAIIKLSKYPMPNITLNLNDALSHRYTTPVYNKAHQLIINHITTAQTSGILETTCTKDLANIAQDFSQSIQ